MVFNLSKLNPTIRHALKTKFFLKVLENTSDKMSALEPVCCKVSGLWSRTCISVVTFRLAA